MCLVGVVDSNVCPRCQNQGACACPGHQGRPPFISFMGDLYYNDTICINKRSCQDQCAQWTPSVILKPTSNEGSLQKMFSSNSSSSTLAASSKINYIETRCLMSMCSDRTWSTRILSHLQQKSPPLQQIIEMPTAAWYLCLILNMLWSAHIETLVRATAHSSAHAILMWELMLPKCLGLKLAYLMSADAIRMSSSGVLFIKNLVRLLMVPHAFTMLFLVLNLC